MRSAVCAAVVSAFLLTATALPSKGAAPADDLAGVTRLLEQKNPDKALQEVDAALKANPKDPRARFLKGIVLSEMGRKDEAISIFVELGNEYPTVAEPLNNLAAVYASLGRFDEARATLETAVRRNPRYGTAQENLGDIYLLLAIRAYDAASQAAPADGDVKKKVQTLKDLAQRGDTATSRSTMALTTKAAAAPVAPESVAAKPAPATPKPIPAVSEDKEVLTLLKKWSDSWASNDVDGYLSAYARDFKVPAGMTRASWEAQRRSRIEKPRLIQLEITDPQVTMTGNGTARVVFNQRYRSGPIDMSDVKTLSMRKTDGAWLIVEEATTPR